MRGDFSRLATHPGNGYRRVMLQQGRVLLDADFNLQGELAAAALRQLTRDLLGPHVGPADDLGFFIGVDEGRVTISRGRYYVDGWLAVNDGAADTLAYEDQEAFPLPNSVDLFVQNRAYFFYLDVWERSVSWLEDPAIRETALGGPDTALRRELVWQVRAIRRPGKAESFDDADKAGRWLREHLLRHSAASAAPGPRLPLMKAFVDPADDPDETPCVADPLGGYKGLENQLYRVEIHAAPDEEDQPATGELTFKWSRENGSVVAAWVDQAHADLTVDGVHDTAHGFSAGQWVELADKFAELRGLPGVMVRLVKVEGNVLTYDPASASGPVPTVADLHDPVIRRWDQRRRAGQDLDGGAIVLQEDKDYALERGVHVRFPRQDPAAENPRRYAVGDYWTFPARTGTADIEWPFELTTTPGQAGTTKTYLAREPDGIEHAYAPLAVVTIGAASGPKSLQRTIIQQWAGA